MACALETLCGQAYGAQQYQRIGTQTYTAIFCLFLVCLPLSLLWIFLGKILVFIGQDPQISYEAGKFTIWLVPALYAYAFLQPLNRYFQTQSLIIPMFLSSCVTLVLHIPLCWGLVFKSGLGNLGGALAISISNWLNVIFLGVYMKFSSACAKTRAVISMEMFQGIGEFFQFAVPSAVMIWYMNYLQKFHFLFLEDIIIIRNFDANCFLYVCHCSLEWWSFELLILMSGLLPNPQLETSVLSVWYVFHMKVLRYEYLLFIKYKFVTVHYMLFILVFSVQ